MNRQLLLFITFFCCYRGSPISIFPAQTLNDPPYFRRFLVLTLGVTIVPQTQCSRTQAQKQGSSVSFPPQNDLNAHCVRLKRRSHLVDSTKTTAVNYVGKTALHSDPLLDQFTTETAVPTCMWDTMNWN